MKREWIGFAHRLAWSLVIGFATSIYSVLPFDTLPGGKTAAKLVGFFDVPISAFGLLLPEGWRGMWLHFFPVGQCRGIAPDASRWIGNQILLAIVVYTTLFYVPTLIRYVRSRRSRQVA